MVNLTQQLSESLKRPDKDVTLWIDDLRNPKDRQWSSWIKTNFGSHANDNVVWVKSYDEFIEYMNKYGLPSIVCFDHDLGDIEWDLDGFDCCKYIVDYCQHHDIDIPDYAIQSSNPAGADNIRSLMNNYHKFYIKNHKKDSK